MNDFFHLPKFSQNFLSCDKLLCSLTTILRRVILFREHDQLKFLLSTFLVRRKISRVLDANKIAKTNDWCEQNFQIFCRRQTLFLCRSANRALGFHSLLASYETTGEFLWILFWSKSLIGVTESYFLHFERFSLNFFCFVIPCSLKLNL